MTSRVKIMCSSGFTGAARLTKRLLRTGISVPLNGQLAALIMIGQLSPGR
jgi:hypothetical protein